MQTNIPNPVEVINGGGSSSVVLACEHASAYIPARFNHLGLLPEHRKSHAAWDPGALALAREISEVLDAKLVAATTSRLVYDCNRPPGTESATPAKSEIVDVPGNAKLTTQERAARAAAYYVPFHAALSAQLEHTPNPVLVTIHSFTPVYHGIPRMVEIGVLHDDDRRLADALLDTAAQHTGRVVARNAPYGPKDGVTHTLREHGVAGGHLNVMLELRNDLIQTPSRQKLKGRILAAWLQDAFARTGAQGRVKCRD